ncbi:50S ribosomal protein P1 [Candidatus Pacearchaeota archaeon]|nr:50S ribosomal protein P1 [Candidatus Pacearchaeota archaeon]
MEYVYGALLLHKLGQGINEESLTRVIKASGAQVDEAKVRVLVTSLKDVDVEKELASASLAVAAAPGASGGAAKPEEKKEEKKEKKEEAAEGLSALFG